MGTAFGEGLFFERDFRGCFMKKQKQQSKEANAAIIYWYNEYYKMRALNLRLRNGLMVARLEIANQANQIGHLKEAEETFNNAIEEKQEQNMALKEDIKKILNELSQ